MKTYLSISELDQLTTAELEALRAYLLDRLAGIPDGSPLRESLAHSLENIERLLFARRAVRLQAIVPYAHL